MIQTHIDNAPGPHSSAQISDCGKYRYLLRRTWNPKLPLCGFLMLNPSTADAMADDPTIRKCNTFAKYWGYGGIIVANVFAWRSTDPDALEEVGDPLGPLNHLAIQEMAEQAEIVLCGWGSTRLVHSKVLWLKSVIADPQRLRCLAMNLDGNPKHPLYVAGSTMPQVYDLNWISPPAKRRGRKS